MENQNNQEQPMDNQMTPDEAAASLAFATKLSEGMMPREEQPIEGPQEPQDAPQPTDSPNMMNDLGAKIDELKSTFSKEIESVKEEIKNNGGDSVKQQVESLRKELTDVLNSDE